MKKTKKLVSMLLAIVMMLTIIPMGTMTAFAANFGTCYFCDHSATSHRDKSGGFVSDGTNSTVAASCDECGGESDCAGKNWAQALEGDDNPLNYSEVHECSNVTSTHYMISTFNGSSFKCKQYTFDSNREKWFVGASEKKVTATKFPSTAAADDGKIYIEDPSNAGTYIECDAAPEWVATIVAKVSACASELLTDGKGASLATDLAKSQDTFESACKKFDDIEYSQNDSVYTIKGKLNSSIKVEYIITLDSAENVVSVDFNIYEGSTLFDSTTYAPAAPTVDFTASHFFCSVCKSAGKSFIANYSGDVQDHYMSAHEDDIIAAMDCTHECIPANPCGDKDCSNTPKQLGESATYWTLIDGVLTISGTGATPDYSYQNPVPWTDQRDNITSVVIENGVTTIGNYFVNGCSKVASVTIPNSVTTIGEAAFMSCKALASITLPNNLTTIGKNAFNGVGITSVSIPNTVTSIGNGAFSFCGNLTSVTLPTGITTIESYTFSKCGSLTSITIPNGVTSIGGSAFSLCGNLASVTIPSSVKSIGTYAFEECVKLDNVTLPEGVTSIGASAFTYCSGLTNVTIPSTVTTIAGGTFRGCSGLTEITLPSSVTKIDTNAFRQCSKLASVVVNATTVPTLGDNVFKDCSSDLVIYVPKESVTDYQTSWIAYENIIEAISTVPCGSCVLCGHGANNHSSMCYDCMMDNGPCVMTGEESFTPCVLDKGHTGVHSNYTGAIESGSATLTGNKKIDGPVIGSGVIAGATLCVDADGWTISVDDRFIITKIVVSGEGALVYKNRVNEGCLGVEEGTPTYGNNTMTVDNVNATSITLIMVTNYNVGIGSITVFYDVATPTAPTPLTFTAEEAGATMSFAWMAGGSDVQIKASSTSVKLNGESATGDWQDYTANTAITFRSVGDSVQFKGTNVTTGSNRFIMNTGKIAASGDVTSLTNGVGGDVELEKDNCYSYMFYNCRALTSAPNLPSTTLSKSCYLNMFKGCTNLTTVPELPATALADSCYGNMFDGCTSLTTTPELPATELAQNCYRFMFYNCTGLTSAPELKATQLATNCYGYMFSGCTGLTTAPELPATQLAENCYIGMFFGCTALTSAPELPATELARSCYNKMFRGCTGLTSAPELKATVLANSCYSDMFSDCTGLKVVETDKQSEATWIFPAEVTATGWNNWMLDGLTAPGTLTSVEAGKMYKVTAVCGLCTECGHPMAKHAIGNHCSLCNGTSGCYDEILGEQCVLDAGHDGNHDSWLPITNTDDINAILTKVAGEFKDAEEPDNYGIEISGNATDGFSYVINFAGSKLNATLVAVKQKGTEYYIEVKNVSEGVGAGYTFNFNSQGKLTGCYQAGYDDYHAYPYIHVHTWDNGTCTLDGTTCSHTNMTTSDATCGTCGITNPNYVPSHTHTYDTAWSTDATQHWHAATCEHTSEKSSLGNHSGGTATCTTQATCSNCGASYGNLANHSYTTKASTQKASDATCTAAATYYVQCDNCTSVSTTATVSVGTANGHSYTTKASTQKASDATCTAAATYYVQCDNCTSVSTTATVSVGTANGHSYTTTASTQKASDATCTAAATYYVKCDNCTSVSTTATVSVGTANGHSFASTYSSDATGHWYAATCGHSSEKSGFATHRSSGPATEEAAEVCLDCGYEIAAKLSSKGKVISVSLANAPKHSHYKCTDTIVPEIDVEGDVNYTVEFTSSNPDLLKVDENGNICGARKWWHKTATVTCTVTDEYGNVVSDTCEIKCGFVWWQYMISIVYLITDAIAPLF